MSNISDISFFNPLLDGYDRNMTKDLGKNDFLNLLVTQLKYQNPLEPIKDQEFVAQLAQFSQLEQLENMSESLTTNTQVDYVMSQTIANTMATTLIGKTVVAEGADFQLIAGENADLSFNLGTDAATVTVTIRNSSGSAVREIQMESVPGGDTTYSWDGRDDNGSPVSPGDYSYEVSALTNTGETVTAEKRIIGTVDSVKYIDGMAYLMVGGYKVDLSTIIEIVDNENSRTNHEG